MNHAIVWSTVPGGVRPECIDGLAKIGKISGQVMAIKLCGGRTGINIGDQVALFDEVLKDLVTGFASPTRDENAFFSHKVSLLRKVPKASLNKISEKATVG